MDTELLFVDPLPIIPTEILHVIASFDKQTYKSLLAIPVFARSLYPLTFGKRAPGIIVDYKIKFGYSIIINNSCIEWFLNGACPKGSLWGRRRHRIDEPAVEYSDGYKEWWSNGCRVSPYGD